MTLMTTDRPPEGSFARRARARLGGFLLAVPGWLGSLLRAGPRGLGLVLAGAFHFARDERRAARIDDMAGTGHARQLIEEEIHQRAMKIRTALIVLPPLALGVAVYAGAVVLPWWQWTLLGLVGWLVCGFIGLPEDAPKVPAVLYMDSGLEPKVDENLITDALSECGITRLSKSIAEGREKGFRAVQFHDTPHRDGAGIAASLSLPAGVTVRQVNDDDQREAFAGAMKRAEERILLTRGEHENHLKLFVADQALRDVTDIPWPLLPSTGGIKPFNIFDPIPVGVDLYGRQTTVTLFRSGRGGRFGLIAGATDSGKTVSGRLIVLAAALDPIVELHINDFKGEGWDEIGLPVAHSYRSGETIEDVEAFVERLEQTRIEIRRRREVRKQLRLDEPELYASGYSEALARRKDLGCHPIVIVVDEPYPFVVDKSNKAEAKIKQQARHLVYEVGRQGRSMGVVVLVMLQSVKDETIPKVFSDNAGLRACFAIEGDSTSVNQALGDGAAGRGYRPDRLSAQHDPGVAYIRGEGTDIQMTRFAYVDNPADLTAIAEAGRQFRIDTGRLTGMAAGEIEPDDHHPDLLDHCEAIWPPEAPNRVIAFVELLDLLARRYHGDYQRLRDAGDETTLGKRLRPAGVHTHQVTAGPLKGRKGVRLIDIRRAIEARDTDRDPHSGDHQRDIDLDNPDTDPDWLSTGVSSANGTVVLGPGGVAEPVAGSSGDGHE